MSAWDNPTWDEDADGEKKFRLDLYFDVDAYVLVVVEQDPKAVSEGHDPQLAMLELAQHPVLEPAKPPYPNYHKK